MKRIFLTAATILLLLGSAHAAENKTITVGGFINTGDAKNADVNLIITKSMITFLSKIPGVKVTPFADVEKSAGDMNFWKTNVLDIETALGLGMRNNARQIIVGDYSVDSTKDAITVNVVVYDVVTGELRLKRTFDGSAGIELFDTIDKMIKNTTFLLLGKTIRMGKLTIDTAVADRTYAIYINGAFQKGLKADGPYEDTIIADEKVEVSLRVTNSAGEEKEVYRNFVTVKENETFSITYAPGGSIIVKAVGIEGARIIMDGAVVGTTDKNGDFTILNVRANIDHSIRVEKDGKQLESRSIRIEEGDSPALVVGTVSRTFLFPVKVVTGTIGLEAGVDFLILRDLRASALVGVSYLSTGGSLAPLAELDAAWCAYRMQFYGDWSFWANLGCYCYIYPFIFSPMIKAEAEWNHVFFEFDLRFSFENIGAGPYMILGAGYRL